MGNFCSSSDVKRRYSLTRREVVVLLDRENFILATTCCCVSSLHSSLVFQWFSAGLEFTERLKHNVDFSRVETDICAGMLPIIDDDGCDRWWNRCRKTGRELFLTAKRIPLWKESRGQWTLTSAGSNGRQQRDHAGGLTRQDTTVMNTLLRKHSYPEAGRSYGSVGEHYCCTLHSLTPAIIPAAITITDANRSGISNSFNAIQPRGLVEMTRRRAVIDSADRFARMRFIRRSILRRSIILLLISTMPYYASNSVARHAESPSVITLFLAMARRVKIILQLAYSRMLDRSSVWNNHEAIREQRFAKTKQHSPGSVHSGGAG